MGTKTDIIRFNVKDRGRKHRGQDRNFDTAKLADLINGPEVQERVKNRDLVGYWGHWPRVKFGLEPGEAALVKGKVVNLEPAVVTTFLKAYPDGTIEHQAEFLDTAPGRLTERMHASKVGGFSSAINAPRRGSMQVPVSFHGFDYVQEPNFTGNRGYAFDSAGNRIDGNLGDEEQAVLDEVGQYTALVDATTAMLDRVQAEYDQQALVVTALHEETVAMSGELAKVKADLQQARRAEKAALDAVAAAKPVEKTVVEPQEPSRQEVLDAAGAIAKREHDTKFASAEAFKNASLTGYDKTGSDEKQEPPNAADNYVARRWGRGH
jgi:hypothetical protein